MPLGGVNYARNGMYTSEGKSERDWSSDRSDRPVQPADGTLGLPLGSAAHLLITKLEEVRNVEETVLGSTTGGTDRR